MKKIIYLFILLFISSCSETPIQNKPTTAVKIKHSKPKLKLTFQDGVNAYNNKDYTTAFNAWISFAKQGNADAQLRVGV